MARKKTETQTAKAQSDFLEALSEGMTIEDAVKAARVSKSLLYKWRKTDATFAEEWKLAYEHGADALEAEAQRRAVEGVERPVYYKGVLCGVTREYSDTLLIFLLKARDPMKFCDRTRAAAIVRQWSAEDGGKDDGSCTPAAEAIAALERIVAAKAALARKPN